MFCFKCGGKISDDSVFCEHCGTRVRLNKNTGFEINAREEMPRAVSAEAKPGERLNQISDEDAAPEKRYDKAAGLFEAPRDTNDIKTAEMIFTRLGDYKDSKQRADECRERFSSMLYSQAKVIFDSSESESSLKSAKNYFQQLGDYKDSKELFEKCDERLQNIAKEEKYIKAVKLLNNFSDDVNLSNAINILMSIAPYKDSAVLIEEGETKIKEFRYNALKRSKDNRTSQTDMAKLIKGFKDLGGYKDSEKLANECLYILNDKQSQGKNKKKKRMIAVYAACIAVVIAVIVFRGIKVTYDNKTAYDNALALYENGKYNAAAEAFIELGTYEDSAQRAMDCYTAIYKNFINQGIDKYNKGNYEAALTCFENAAIINSKSETTNWKEKCYEGIYQEAAELYNNGNYTEASENFSKISGYKDADEMAVNCLKGNTYASAIESYNAGNYEDALALFNTIAGYKDTDTYIDSINRKSTLEDCKQAYINYLKTPRSYNGYVVSDLDYLLYDFDGSGIPELVICEYAGAKGDMPTQYYTILTYNESQGLTTLYKDIDKLNTLMSNSGKLYFKTQTYDTLDKYNVYEGILYNGNFSVSVVYRDITGPIEDYGLSYYYSYDGSDPSPIYNY